MTTTPEKPDKTQQPLSDAFVPDEARFRQCAEPRSREEITAAMDAFHEAVSAARLEHRIRNVYVVADIAVLESDGQESTAQVSFSYGAAWMALPLVAAAYGSEKQRHVEMLAKLLQG